MKTNDNPVQRVIRETNDDEDCCCPACLSRAHSVMNKLLTLDEDDDENDQGFISEEDSPDPLAVGFENHIQEITELKALDIVFLIDATASMNNKIRGIKRLIRQILWTAPRFLSQLNIDDPDAVKIGVVIYRDHLDDPVVEIVTDLSSDMKSVKEKMLTISARGGRDLPEAVLDGIAAVLEKISWRESSVRLLYHILDAPPHGKNFTSSVDDYEDGCPCKLNYDELLNSLKKMKIEYNIIKLANTIEKMIELFGEYISINIITPDILIETKKNTSQFE